jgi:hypothetical protein
MSSLITRAVEEGRLPAGLSADLIMDMWAGALFYRGLFKHVPVSDDLAAQLVDTLFGRDAKN